MPTAEYLPTLRRNVVPVTSGKKPTDDCRHLPVGMTSRPRRLNTEPQSGENGRVWTA